MSLLAVLNLILRPFGQAPRPTVRFPGRIGPSHRHVGPLEPVDRDPRPASLVKGQCLPARTGPPPGGLRSKGKQVPGVLSGQVHAIGPVTPYYLTTGLLAKRVGRDNNFAAEWVGPILKHPLIPGRGLVCGRHTRHTRRTPYLRIQAQSEVDRTGGSATSNIC